MGTQKVGTAAKALPKLNSNAEIDQVGCSSAQSRLFGGCYN